MSNYCINQPKPIAGEWTADADGVLLPLHRFIGQYAKEIAEAHNAALAAEWEDHQRTKDTLREEYGKFHGDDYADMNAARKRILDLEDQLAAERKRAIADTLTACEGQVRQLEQQLAAEREEHGRITANLAMQVQEVTHQLTTVRELRELDQKALAAEREKVHKAESQSEMDIVAIQQLRQQLATERGNVGITCTLSGPGRGDCEHFVGYPSPIHIPNQHDGPDDTVDVYGKPNGWCWTCWKSRQLSDCREQLAAERRKVHPLVELLQLCRCNESARRDWDLMDAIDKVMPKVKEAK